jgi:polar amino acid transport system substrate-binding protein
MRRRGHARTRGYRRRPKRGNIATHARLQPIVKTLLFLLALCCPLSQGATLVAYTEESAPYHYTDRGQVVGIAADFLRAACKSAAIDCTITMLPWARAYVLTRNQPNTLIFSIVRRPDREQEFLWVSPIITEGVWIWGRADAPPLGPLSRLGKVQIGAINGGSGSTYLLQAGVPQASIDLANSIEANFKKFAAGRIDYMVDTETRFDMEASRYALPFKAKKLLKLREATSYFAMNLRSDPATVAALRAALEKLRAEKLLEQLTKKYAPPA